MLKSPFWFSWKLPFSHMYACAYDLMRYVCRWTFVNHCCSSLCKQWTNYLETGYRSAASSPFCAIASYSGKIVRQYPSSFQTINGQLTLCRGLDRRILNHLTLYCSRATDKDCTISNQSFWSRKCFSNSKQPGSIVRYNFFVNFYFAENSNRANKFWFVCFSPTVQACYSSCSCLVES